jgi:hypothetical protein
MLNKRLKLLRNDEQSLKATIGELITATEIAERAIGGLKHTVRDVNDNLGNQIVSATELSRQLAKQLAEGDALMRRLSRIALAARPATAPEPEVVTSDARSVAAAARAFSERRRASGLAA